MSELYGDESPVLSPAQPATTRSVKYILYFYVDPEFQILNKYTIPKSMSIMSQFC